MMARLGKRDAFDGGARLWTVLVPILATALSLQAQMTVQVSSATPVVIPDDNPGGAQSSMTVSAPWTEIGAVRVELRIESASAMDPIYNGDLFVYLTHTDSGNKTGLTVLLNRVGRDAGNSLGFGDSGFNVAFSDSNSQGDIHTYRTTLYGNDDTAIPNPGALTGTWSPDGRETDPDFVLTTHDRTAGLSSFHTLNPNGLWTLFLADLSSGSQAKLTSWSLTLDPVPVPEPSWSVLLVAAGLLGWAGRRHRASRSGLS